VYKIYNEAESLRNPFKIYTRTLGLFKTKKYKGIKANLEMYKQKIRFGKQISK